MKPQLAAVPSFVSARVSAKFNRFVAFVLLFVVLGSSHSFAATFDVTADFSATNNPAGAWSYGYRTTPLSSDFNLYLSSGNFTGVDFWFLAGTGLPDVGKTPDPGGRIIMHPGNTAALESFLSVVRWTAPADGLYDLDTVFTGDDSRGPNVNVFVVRNGLLEFTANIPANGVSRDYSDTFSLSAGDFIDFAVGNNNNVGNRNFTRLEASLSAVPIPAALPLFVSAVAGLGFVSWWRKRLTA